jgi:hypothetical protein
MTAPGKQAMAPDLAVPQPVPAKAVMASATITVATLGLGLMAEAAQVIPCSP